MLFYVLKLNFSGEEKQEINVNMVMFLDKFKELKLNGTKLKKQINTAVFSLITI